MPDLPQKGVTYPMARAVQELLSLPILRALSTVFSFYADAADTAGAVESMRFHNGLITSFRANPIYLYPIELLVVIFVCNFLNKHLGRFIDSIYVRIPTIYNV